MNSIAWVLSKLRFPLKTELGGMDTAYISGFIPRYISGTSFAISAGAAFAPGSGKVLSTTAETVISGLPALTADVFYYIYAYDNNGVTAFETVTTAPSEPYAGTARTKSGDPTRRFVCAVRTGAGATFYRFQWGGDGYTRYLAQSSVAPFRVISGSTSTVKINGDCSGVVPVNSVLALVSLSNTSTNTLLQISHPDAGATDVIISIAAGTRIVVPLILDSLRRLALFNAAASGQAFADVIGYGNER